MGLRSPIDGRLMRYPVIIDTTMHVDLALYCIACHWLVLHCTASHRIAEHCLALDCMALRHIAYFCTVLYYTALNCVARRSWTLYCAASYHTALHYIPSHSITVCVHYLYSDVECVGRSFSHRADGPALDAHFVLLLLVQSNCHPL